MLYAQTVMNKIDVTESCWLWGGQLNYAGYGVFTWREAGKAMGRGAHRVVYEMFKGEPDRNLTLDHLCENKQCVNPDHLEPVTIGENIRRRPSSVSQVCKYGHSYKEQSSYYKNKGARRCHTCHALDETRRRIAA